MPILGRNLTADIVIQDPTVSGRHAEIRHLENDLYTLIDLGSTNGTFVNGRQISTATVRLSDNVQLGTRTVDLTQYRHRIPRVTPKPADHDPLPRPMSQKYEPEPVLRQNAPQPPVQQRPQYGMGTPGMGTEVAAALAAQQTYGGKAFLVWVLYWFGWLPGFIMNCVYLNEANRFKKMTGVAPSGMGCLTFLFFTHFLLPLLLIFALILTGGALMNSILRMFR